jgi:RNA polymerase sigma-70 factor (ECF subfamily)
MNPSQEIDDVLLLLRAREGDADAFTRFVLRWQDRLRAHALRLTDDQVGADDVLQETWIAVLKGLRRLSDLESYRTWIYRILGHKAADWVRSRQRQRRLRWRYAEAHSSADKVESQHVQTLDEVFKLLTAPLRHVVLLHYIEEFTIEDIAEILGIPRGTVKSRLHYARKRLRALIEEQNIVRAE